MIRNDTGSPMAPTSRAALPGGRKKGWESVDHLKNDSATGNGEENVWSGINCNTPHPHLDIAPQYILPVPYRRAPCSGSATDNAEK